jgi:hypothetical protein
MNRLLPHFTSRGRRGAIAAIAMLVSVVSPCHAAEPVPSLTSTPLVLAQASSQRNDSYRLSGRSTRGLVKLGIGAVVALVAGGGWVIRKIRGEDD